MSRILKVDSLWFWALGAFWALYEGLSSYSLLNNNEGLYAEIAFEMFKNKSFVIPTLNGVPYIEKPPLLYWLVASSYALFGKSVWAARFVPATFGCLTVLSLFLFYRSLGKVKEGLYGVLILASSLGFIVFSRMVFFDGLLTAFLTFSLLSFYQWRRQKTVLWKALFFAFLGGAIMAKGLLSLCLVGATTLIFIIMTERSWKAVFSLLDPLGLLVFFAITAPWHILACLQLPEFSWFYFINEHVLRFLDQRQPRDYYRGPFYYYLIRLPAYFLPWTLLFPFWGKTIQKSDADHTLRLFVWIWFLVPLVFFTLSRAKANYYMMVGMPPLVLLLVEYGKQRIHFDRLVKIGALLAGILVTVSGFVLPRYDNQLSSKEAVDFLTKHPFPMPLYLYKRFEHISSFVFYYGLPVPLVESESADLAFGKTLSNWERSFLDWQAVAKEEKEVTFVVCPRDEKEFKEKAQGREHLLYSSPSALLYTIDFRKITS